MINTEQNINTSINEGILKSFDNIMCQQEKMDKKAYIFIGFLGVLIGLLHKKEMPIFPLILVLSVTVIPFIISLLPVATQIGVKIIGAFIKNEQNNEHNIFYYLDLYKLNRQNFVEILEREYNYSNPSKFDLKLIDQIIINAQILKLKVWWHTLSQYIFFGSLIIWGIILFINAIF